MGSDISTTMKTAALVLAFALGVSADGLGGHSHAHAPVRRGRQEEAPLDAYAQPAYGEDLDTAASDVADPLAMLQGAIPGVPGEDYPIYAEVPESGFACDGQVDGGYYADPEAECQVFHICTADGAGGLAKYSFLCPNGTILNQNYFICDWWFNFDCATAEDLYSLNDEIAAERDDLAVGASDQAAYGESGSGAAPAYAAPAPAPPAEEDYPAYDDLGSGEVTEAPASGYGAPADEGSGSGEGSGLDVYGETTVAPADAYLPPAEEARRNRRLKAGGKRRGKGGARRSKGSKGGKRRQGRKGSRRLSQNRRRPVRRG